MHTTETAKKILHFWFGDLENGQVNTAQQKIWWNKNPEVDHYIRTHFQQDLLNAVFGKYNDWLENPHGTLALILLADQFSRHIYRNTPEAFAADTLAIEWAQTGIAKKHDAQLNFFERAFFYLPFEHAENITLQQQSVNLFQELYEQAHNEQKKLFKTYLEYAQQHQSIIQRFGRFPHRNKILKRSNTEEENIFLLEPNSSF